MYTGRKWLRGILYLAAMGLALQLVGCGSSKTYGTVEFVTIPPGAEVVNLKDDATLGMTPVQVTWEGEDGKPEYVTVEFTKKGYRNDITSFWVNTRHESREAAAAEAQPVTVELKKRK
jgi:hypothetical protein